MAHIAPPDARTFPEISPLAPLIRRAAVPLPALDDPGFGACFDRFANARVVLLGEASHGTREFYRARAAITRRLIEHHGFGIVAVEADWPDAAAIDRYVRHRPPRTDAEAPFQRFPTWMWRNAEVDAFVRWLRAHNNERSASSRAAFYGLDLYSLSSSIRAVIEYLDRVDPDAARIARERYGCLTPWRTDPQRYGRAALSAGYSLCEKAVVAMLRQLLDKQREYREHGGETFLDAAQNARLVRDAEAYYRTMYYADDESWNLRDRHMFETLQQILAAKGETSKAVVWAHNSHIGDARHTEMGSVRNELNVGQLVREHYGDQSVLIGFGTHAGTVAAATDWGGPMEVKQVRPSLSGSHERVSHDAGLASFLLDLRECRHDDGPVTRDTTTRDATTRDATTRDATTRDATTDDGPVTRDTTTRDTTTRDTTTRDTTIRDTTTRDTTTRDTMTRDATTRDTTTYGERRDESPTLSSNGLHEELRRAFSETRLERFIGVIYRPDTERWSHYAEASLAQQFDAWVWFDETQAVSALEGKPTQPEADTYPFGL